MEAENSRKKSFFAKLLGRSGKLEDQEQEHPLEDAKMRDKSAGLPRQSGDGGAALYRELEALTAAVARQPPNFVDSPMAANAAPLSDAKAAMEKVKATQSHKVRTKRLMKELKSIQTCAPMRDGIFSVTLNDDNLFEWDVKVRKWDEESLLAFDMMKMKKQYGICDIWIRISFPDNFPFDPPFVRVLAPLVQGGFVLGGGAICMELLTDDGWSQAYTMEAVIMQMIATITKGQARIVSETKTPFSREEADKAYSYLVDVHKKHGWFSPPVQDG